MVGPEVVRVKVTAARVTSRHRLEESEDAPTRITQSFHYIDLHLDREHLLSISDELGGEQGHIAFDMFIYEAHKPAAVICH